MAIYALRSTASLEVLSIVEYDGSSSYDYLSALGLELYSGSMIEEFTAQEHTPYDLYDPIHGLHITSEVGSVLKGFNYMSGSLSLIGDVFSTGSQYLEGELNVAGELNALGSITVSGSLNISGSVLLGDENFDETFKIAPKPCTILKYEEDVINQLPTDGGLNPQGGYFIFDKDTSINGDYGENSWRVEKPTRIRLNLQTLGDTVQQNDYEEKLFKIIRERLGESEITLEQILPNNSFTAAYKKFAIIRGIYRERSIRNDANREYPVRYHYLDWGSQDFVETDRYFGQEDIDYFYGDGPFGLDFSGTGTNSARDGFFEFEVKQLEPLNVNPILKPEQDAEFRVCVRHKEYRREITVFNKSGKYTFPYWADQITIYTVGAGGGGGGGAWGYPHKIEYDVDTTRVDGNSKMGHDFAIGGGGGAGGSVAISSYSNRDIGQGTVLNVFVGSPGKGGLGLDYSLQYNSTNNIPFLVSISNLLDPVKRDVTLTGNPLAIAMSGGLPNYYGTTNDASKQFRLYKGVAAQFIDPNVGNYANVVIPSADNIGKKGGDSFVSLNNGNILVKAQGGSGGNCGFSVIWSHPLTHINCGLQTLDGINNDNDNRFDLNDSGVQFYSHNFDYGIVMNGTPTLTALGGGGSTQESIGNITRPGGHGGYGMCTPPYHTKRIFFGNNPNDDQKYGFNEEFNTMNVAPNIPWTYNQGLRGLKLPMGRLQNSIMNISLFDVASDSYIAIDGRGDSAYANFSRTNLSKEKPMELAPPGGGGGFGVRYVDLETRLTFSNEDSGILITKDTKNSQKIVSSKDFDSSPSQFRAHIFIDNNEMFVTPTSFYKADVSVDYVAKFIGNDETTNPEPGEILFVTDSSVGFGYVIKVHDIDSNGINRAAEWDKVVNIYKLNTFREAIKILNISVENKLMNTMFYNAFDFKKFSNYHEIAFAYAIDTSTAIRINYKELFSKNNGNQNLKIILSSASSNDYDFTSFYSTYYDNFMKLVDNKSIIIEYSGQFFIYNTLGSATLKPVPNNQNILGISIPIDPLFGIESYKITTVKPIVTTSSDNNFDLIEFNNLSSYNPSVGNEVSISITKDKWSNYNPLVRPFDGLQRFYYINNVIKLGTGGKVLLNNKYLLDATDSNGQNVKIELADGGNGGFAQYFTPKNGYLELRPDLSNTLPEDVSNRIGVGGGGGAAVYLKKYEDKDRIGDPDVPSKGQDGADGGPGIVVIVADKYSF